MERLFRSRFALPGLVTAIAFFLTVATGTSGTVIRGQLLGDEIVDYVLNERGGQRMVIDMTADNPSAYFNLTPSANPEAIHIDSVAGNHYHGTLPSSGDWVIRVFLMRNAARRGEATDYTRTVDTGGTAHPVHATDFADGGPDFWEVVDVSAGEYVNVRSGPSTKYSIVARAANGQSFRNLGCRGTGRTRWCHVETAEGSYSGWVSGRYLREGVPPSATGPGIVIPSESGVTPDLYMRPTGEIEVRWSGGCTVLYNLAGQRIQAGSSCSGNQLEVSDVNVARFRR